MSWPPKIHRVTRSKNPDPGLHDSTIVAIKANCFSEGGQSTWTFFTATKLWMVSKVARDCWKEFSHAKWLWRGVPEIPTTCFKTILWPWHRDLCCDLCCGTVSSYPQALCPRLPLDENHVPPWSERGPGAKADRVDRTSPRGSAHGSWLFDASGHRSWPGF